MTTLDFTPASVDLTFWAGDDPSFPLFFSTDAPDGGEWAGDWVDSLAYAVGDIVEHSATFYAALVASTNVTPGADPSTWVALTPLDLTGYTAWKAQIRSSETDGDAFTIDATQQAASIVTLSIAGTVLRTRLTKGPQRWDLQVTGPDSKIRTLFAGRVFIRNDASR